MKRMLGILSLITLVALGAGMLGQTLIVAFGVYYTPSGDPANPTPIAIIATALAAGGLLAMPLTGIVLILGLIIIAQDRAYGWLAALIAASLLAFVGLVVMALVILSAQSPIAFQTPLLLISLVTALYSRTPSSNANANAGVQH